MASSSAAPPRPRARALRVLCLHGFRTNAAVMRNQTKDLRAALGEDAEFIFLNGAREARGPSDATIERLHAEDKPFYEWVQARKATPSDPGYIPDDKHWTWMLDNLDFALAYLDRKLHEIGPVDIVVGFSQGAIMLTLLSMLYLQREPHRPVRWWKLCICVGGVAVRGLPARPLFETPDGKRMLVPFPSIHIVGKKDIFYKDGWRLAQQYDDYPTTASRAISKRMFVHGGGHKFPSAAKNPGLYEEIAHLIRTHFEEIEANPAVSRL